LNLKQGGGVTRVWLEAHHTDGLQITLEVIFDVSRNEYSVFESFEDNAARE